MLRIELLPDYIHDKNKIFKLWGAWGAALLLVIIVLFASMANANRANDAAKLDKDTKEGLKKTTDDTKTAIAAEVSHRQNVEVKQKFVLGAITYNDGWPEVFETIRDVKPADNSIILDSMALDATQHKTVSLTGFGQDEKAIVRWWMSLRNNTGLFDHVNFDLVAHAYPGDQASNGGGTGRPGPGSMMGMSGGMMGMSGGMMGMSGGMMGMSGGMMGMSGGMMGMSGGMGRGMGMGRGGGGTSSSNGPGELAGRQGINFTAAVVLRTALAGGIPAPSWTGGAAPAPAGGGMFGGSGGMGGGMSGGGPPAGSGGGKGGGA